MTIADLGEADFLAGLQALMPRGLAWSRDPEAGLTKLLSGLAATQSRQHARTGDLSERESDPAQTLELLAEWEAAYGLPDPCLPLNATIEQRRNALLARIAARGGQSRAYFVQVAAALGFEIAIEEFRPFRVGMRVGARLYGEDWAHAWRINAPGTTVTPFRLGRSAVGERLRIWGNDPLDCVMSRLKPAHTILLLGSYTAEWDFTAGMPDGATLERASPATHIDAAGALAEDAADAARPDYDPTQEMNLVGTAAWFGGAVTGSPGTVPAGWALSGDVAGLTRTIVGVGEEDGIPYLDVAWVGTTTANVNLDLAGPLVPAVAGEQLAGTICSRRRAGPMPGQIQTRIAEYQDGVSLSVGGSSFATVTAGALAGQVRQHVRTLTDAATNQARLVARIFVADGTAVAFTIRYGFPTLTKAATPITARVPLTTLAQRNGTVPQYALRGMLLEVAETNLNTNPRAEGATPGAIGSGGAVPTGWNIAAPSGVTVTIVGVETRGGVPGLLVRFAGTSPSGFVHTIRVGGVAMTVPAGTVVANEAWIGLAAGSVANVSGWQFRCANELAGALAFTPGPVARLSCVQTTAATSSSTVLRWQYAAGQPVDFTLFIGAPDRKHGLGLVSSVSLPPVGAPGASARAADVLRLDLPDGTYNATVLGGTVDAGGVGYPQQIVATGGLGAAFAWPAAAVAAGERHLRKLSLRRAP